MTEQDPTQPDQPADQPADQPDKSGAASDAEPREGALPGGGDSQYGNDTGFADAALGGSDDAGGTPEDQPGG